MSNIIHKVIIIGGGCAGYTAAIYTARALLSPIVISGNLFGGQLMNTTEVENFPGYPNGVQGPDMMNDIYKQAERFGAKFIISDVTEINIKTYPFIILTNNGEEFFTHSIIIATGAEPLWINAEGENELRSSGISTCATCDGAFFKNEELLVIGGGDSAFEEAIFLTRFASKVTIVNRRDEFRASKIMVERAKNNKKIFFKTFRIVKKWNTNENGVLISALLTDPRDNTIEEVIPCGGGFIAIGHKPTTSFLPKEIETDEDGYILHKKNTMTSVNGVFACGDVVDKRYKQAITAAGQGCQSAIDCERWLEEHNL